MNSLEGGTNAIILLFTAMAVGGTLLAAFLASRHKRRSRSRALIGAAGIISLAYAGGLIAASGTSTDRLLAPGDTKWFCWFYLDCHLGLSVERIEKTGSIPGGASPLQAAGEFHILTLRLHNSAKNPNVDMMLYRPRAEVVDASGRRHKRSEAAEAAIARSGRPSVLGTETRVMREPVDATIVFDLPRGIQSPRLLVSEGWILDRVIELALLGDENSLLHGRTYIALEEAAARTAAR